MCANTFRAVAEGRVTTSDNTALVLEASFDRFYGEGWGDEFRPGQSLLLKIDGGPSIKPKARESLLTQSQLLSIPRLSHGPRPFVPRAGNRSCRLAFSALHVSCVAVFGLDISGLDQFCQRGMPECFGVHLPRLTRTQEELLSAR